MPDPETTAGASALWTPIPSTPISSTVSDSFYNDSFGDVVTKRNFHLVFALRDKYSNNIITLTILSCVSWHIIYSTLEVLAVELLSLFFFGGGGGTINESDTRLFYNRANRAPVAAIVPIRCLISVVNEPEVVCVLSILLLRRRTPIVAVRTIVAEWVAVEA